MAARMMAPFWVLLMIAAVACSTALAETSSPPAAFAQGEFCMPASNRSVLMRLRIDVDGGKVHFDAESLLYTSSILSLDIVDSGASYITVDASHAVYDYILGFGAVPAGLLSPSLATSLGNLLTTWENGPASFTMSYDAKSGTVSFGNDGAFCFGLSDCRSSDYWPPANHIPTGFTGTWCPIEYGAFTLSNPRMHVPSTNITAALRSVIGMTCTPRFTTHTRYLSDSPSPRTPSAGVFFSFVFDGNASCATSLARRTTQDAVEMWLGNEGYTGTTVQQQTGSRGWNSAPDALQSVVFDQATDSVKLVFANQNATTRKARPTCSVRVPFGVFQTWGYIDTAFVDELEEGDIQSCNLGTVWNSPLLSHPIAVSYGAGGVMLTMHNASTEYEIRWKSELGCCASEGASCGLYQAAPAPPLSPTGGYCFDVLNNDLSWTAYRATFYPEYRVFELSVHPNNLSYPASAKVFVPYRFANLPGVEGNTLGLGAKVVGVAYTRSQLNYTGKLQGFNNAYRLEFRDPDGKCTAADGGKDCSVLVWIDGIPVTAKCCGGSCGPVGSFVPVQPVHVSKHVLDFEVADSDESPAAFATAVAAAFQIPPGGVVPVPAGGDHHDSDVLATGPEQASTAPLKTVQLRFSNASAASVVLSRMSPRMMGQLNVSRVARATQRPPQPWNGPVPPPTPSTPATSGSSGSTVSKSTRAIVGCLMALVVVCALSFIIRLAIRQRAEQKEATDTLIGDGETSLQHGRSTAVAADVDAP